MLFVEVVKKISELLIDIQKETMEATIPEAAHAPTATRGLSKTNWKSVEVGIDDELEEASNETTKAL